MNWRMNSREAEISTTPPDRENIAMNAATGKFLWVIYFVGFDDTTDDEAAGIEPQIYKERIETSPDAEQAWQDVSLAVLVRGGQLLTICADDEEQAESIRAATEFEILRRR
jgi:hypothetical protein